MNRRELIFSGAATAVASALPKTSAATVSTPPATAVPGIPVVGSDMVPESTFLWSMGVVLFYESNVFKMRYCPPGDLPDITYIVGPAVVGDTVDVNLKLKVAVDP